MEKATVIYDWIHLASVRLLFRDLLISYTRHGEINQDVVTLIKVSLLCTARDTLTLYVTLWTFVAIWIFVCYWAADGSMLGELRLTRDSCGAQVSLGLTKPISCHFVSETPAHYGLRCDASRVFLAWGPYDETIAVWFQTYNKRILTFDIQTFLWNLDLCVDNKFLDLKIEFNCYGLCIVNS